MSSTTDKNIGRAGERGKLAPAARRAANKISRRSARAELVLIDSESMADMLDDYDTQLERETGPRESW